VSFSTDELRKMLYCCASEMRARRSGKPPGPQPWLSNLIRRLELELAVSDSGHDFGWGATDLNHDSPISAREAGVILGLSKRQVQRLAADLEGQLIDGRWIFPESIVKEYAEGLTDARDTA
jgi:hypothetical protein